MREMGKLTGAHYHHLCKIIDKMDVAIPDHDGSDQRFALALSLKLIGSMYKAQKEFDELLIDLLNMDRKQFEKFKNEEGEEYFSLCQDIMQNKAFVKLFQLSAN